MNSLEYLAHHPWVYRPEEVGNVHCVNNFLIHVWLGAVEYRLFSDSPINARRQRSLTEYVRVDLSLQKHQLLIGNVQNSNAAVLLVACSRPIVKSQPRDNMIDDAR